MADNRYKGGRHINRHARVDTKRAEYDRPETYGWQFAYNHPVYYLRVYTKGHYKLMAHPDKIGWLIDDTRSPELPAIDPRHIRVISGELSPELEGVT